MQFRIARHLAQQKHIHDVSSEHLKIFLRHQGQKAKYHVSKITTNKCRFDIKHYQTINKIAGGITKLSDTSILRYAIYILRWYLPTKIV